MGESVKTKIKVRPTAMFLSVSAVLFLLGPLVYAGVAPFVPPSPIISYALLFIPYVLSLFAIIALGEGRKKAAEGRDGKDFSPKRAIALFLVSLSFLTVASLLDKPERNEGELTLKLLSLLVTFLFIPIQTGVEEYLFRVLPLKMAPSWPRTKKSAILISIISGLLFLLPHTLNPEALGEGGGWALAHYFTWGFLAALSAVASGGFEIPFAMHAANNFFVGAIVNYPGSVLPSFPFFMATRTKRGMTEIIVTVIHFAFVFMAFYILERRKRNAK